MTVATWQCAGESINAKYCGLCIVRMAKVLPATNPCAYAQNYRVISILFFVARQRCRYGNYNAIHIRPDKEEGPLFEYHLINARFLLRYLQNPSRSFISTPDTPESYSSYFPLFVIIALWTYSIFMLPFYSFGGSNGTLPFLSISFCYRYLGTTLLYLLLGSHLTFKKVQ